ncbi:hypothetical protein BC830DRAFT_1085294 [Chytriomyces sp. MP71]|nr:hypothetical protein BC830DRAFT_1085294 [Chytriomyces sp. MP71]
MDCLSSCFPKKTENVATKEAAPASAPSAAFLPVTAVQPVSRSAPVAGTYALYSRGYCPFTQQVRMAMAFKGIQGTFTKWGPNDTPPEWFKTASPDGSVPVLQFPTGEYTNSSAAMIERFQTDVASPTLYPGDVEACNAWAKTIRTEFCPAFNKVLMGTNPQVQAEFRPKLQSALKKITDQLAVTSGPFLLGNEFSIADLLLSPFLRRLQLITFFRGIPFTDAKLQAYIDTLEKQPFVAKVAYDIEEMKRFFVKAIPKQKPMSLGRLQHIAIRKHYETANALATSLANGTVTDVPAVAAQLKEQVRLLVLLVQAHASFEENVIYPVFEEASSGSTSRAHAEHVHEGPLLIALGQEVAEVVDQITAGGASVVAGDAFAAVRAKLEASGKEAVDHMAGEEQHLFPLTSNLGDKELPLVANIFLDGESTADQVLPFVYKALTPQERMQYFHNLSEALGKSYPEKLKWCKGLLETSLSKAEWDDLVFRLPSLASL